MVTRFIDASTRAIAKFGLLVCLLVLMLVSVAGCGGSGGSSSAAGVSPTIDISWSQRSRDFSGPSSALSATITVTAVPSGSSTTLSVNRLSNLYSYSQTYALGSALRPGPVQVSVQFFAAANAAGAVVGNATTAAILTAAGGLTTSAGTALGSIVTSATVATVTVPTGQTIAIGTPTQLTFTALDAGGNVVAVSPGSAVWNTQNTTYLSITQDGIATGNSAGTGSVSALVDGVQSAVTTITVKAPVNTNYLVVSQTVSNLVFNPADAKLYAVVPASASANANSLIAIDPSTGGITKSIYIGSNPGAMALSSDGTVLYVALDGSGTVCAVSLPSMTPQTPFSLGIGSSGPNVAYSLAAMPGSPQTVVVVGGSSNSSPENMTVYDSGVARANTVTSYPSVATSITFSSSATTLYGASPFGGLSYTIDSNGITQTGSVAGLQNVNGIQTVAGKIYSSSGQVYDASTGSLLGTLPLGTDSQLNWYATNAAGTQAYLVASPLFYTFQYRVASATNYTQIGTATLPFTGFYSLEGVAAIGTSGLAIGVAPQQGDGEVIIIKNALQGISVTVP